MKNNILLLCKVQFFEQFKLNEFRSRNSKYRNRFLLMLVTTIVLSVTLMTYSYMIGVSFSQMGLSNILPVYGLVISSLLTLFFTILKTNGTLFAFKDYEMVMSLPIKTSAVISSRFLMMYCINLVMVLLVMFPMGIAFVQYNTVSMMFYPIWLIGIIIAPLFPTTIASMIGALIAWLSSKFRYSNAVATVFSIIFLITFMVVSFFVGRTGDSSIPLESMVNMGSTLGDIMNKIYPLAIFFTKAVIDSNLISLMIFVVFSVGWYMLFIALLSSKYKAINTALLTHKTLSNYELAELRKASPLKALYKKELKRFFSSTVYVINIGVGVIMVLLLSIAVLFVTPDMLARIIPSSNVEGIIERILPFVICGLLGMSCTTCVSLSLEGKNIWILKSLPIHAKSIFQSKMLVNLTLLIPAALLSSMFLSIRFASSFFSVVLIILVPLIYCFFITTWGMFVDIKMYAYDWVSETAIIKQSMNSAVGLLGSAFLGLVPIAFLLLMKNANLYLITAIVVTVILGATGFLYRKICKASIRI